MSEKVKSIFLDNTTVLSDQIVDHNLTVSWKTIFGDENPNAGNSSLIAYWRLNDITGADSSGNGHNITWLSGTPFMTQATPFKNKNNTVLFNGTANHGSVVDHDNLSFGNSTVDQPFSISCWINPEALTLGSYSGIVSKADEYNLYIENNSGGDKTNEYSVVLKLFGVASNMFQFVFDEHSISKDSWFNIVVTYNGQSSGPATDINFYINGVRKISNEISNGTTGTYVAMSNTASDMIIGRYDALPGTYIKGALSELAIWNRELTAIEAKALHDVKYGVVASLGTYTSYSPRIMLRDKDNQRGQYSTARRTGDKDRTGTFNIQFNDENTVEFKKIPTVYPGEKDKSFSITDSGSKYTYSSQANLVAHWRPQDVVIPTTTVSATPLTTPSGVKLFVGGTIPVSDTAYIENKVAGGQIANIKNFATILSTDDPRYNSYTERDGKLYDSIGSRNSYKYLSNGNNVNDGLNIGTASIWDAIIGSNTAGGSTKKMTFSMWAKRNVDTGTARLLDFGNTDISLYIDSAERIWFKATWDSPADPVWWNSASSVLTSNWQNIVITYDATVTTNDPVLYVDSVSIPLTETSGPPTGTLSVISTDDCYIGNDAGFTNVFNGYIADVAIWNSTLTSAEVKAIYLNDTRWNPDISSTQEVQYPMGLLKGDSRLPGLVTDITTKGLITRSHSGESFNIITDGEDISAYNDELVKTQDTDFYNTGTDREVYPGFSSPLRSKTSFTFDITAIQDQYVFRQNYDTVSAGEFHPDALNNTLDYTGFCYYSFTENKWVQKGETNFRYGFDPNNPGTTGPVSFPSQFAGPSNFLTRLNEDTQDSTVTKEVLGYDKIGMPTITNLAPWATKYHALDAEILDTDFIKSPFLLEKISINLPIYAKHILDNNILNDRQKEMSNYMIFLYLQKRVSTVQDSQDDIDTSERILIASSSICFYNKNVLYDVVMGGNARLVKDFYPIHDTGFSHGFDFTNDGTSGAEIKEFNDNITLEFLPSIFGQNYTVSKIPTYVPSVYSISTNNYCHFWPGGNSITPFKIDNVEVGGKSLTNSLSLTKGTDSNYTPFEEYTNLKSVSEKYSKIGVDKNIQRHQKNIGIELKETQITSSVALINQSSQPTSIESYSTSSPFLLLPGDSIVLGIEKCAGDYITAAGEEESLSGSYIKIKAEPASMTLYGSLIKENKEFHNTLNQDLTSNSVHEAYYGEPVLDQFEIEPISMYARTTRDEYVTGDMSTLDGDSIPIGTRGVTKRVTDGDVTDSWSLARFNTFADENERYYDTLLPDVGQILSNIGLINLSDASIDWTSGTFIDPDDPTGVATLAYSDLSTNLMGIRTGSLHIELKDLGDGSHPPPYTGFLVTGDDTLAGVHDATLDKTNLFVDGRLANPPSLVHEYHSEDPDYSLTLPSLDVTRGMKAKYQYAIDFFPGHTIPHFPFTTSVTRTDNTEFSILTRYATEYGLYEESDWWRKANGDPYPSPPNNMDAQESFYHTGSIAVLGAVIGFGPHYEIMTNTQIKNLIFRNSIDSLTTEDTVQTRLVLGTPTAFKYEYGFNSTISSSGELSSYAYGVRDIESVTSTAVFRSNSYGQFRDMLEQRHYGRFYKQRDFTPRFASSPGFQGRNMIASNDFKQSTFITKGPIEIKFVEENSSTQVADPQFTNSSNLSPYATSSLPFFDDLTTYPSGSNRTYTSDTLNSAVLSTQLTFDISGA